jgi:putative transcription factor
VDIPSEGIMIEVDGAKLFVCERCKRFGTEVKKQIRKRDIPPTKTVTRISLKTPNVERPKLRREGIGKVEMQYELVDDYPQQIRHARESSSLTQSEFAQKIGERLSIVQKLETGKIRPSDAIIEKINRILRINLRTAVEEDLPSYHHQKPNLELTIGDMAKSVVKKKDD